MHRPAGFHTVRATDGMSPSRLTALTAGGGRDIPQPPRLCYHVSMQTVDSDHSRIDERSLAMHRLIAAKVRADPALLDKARDNVRRWQESEGSPKLALAEWEHLLGGPVSQVTQFIAERSDHATRLRQSSPFAGILTEAERLAIYESYSTRTYHPGGQPHLG